MDNLQVYESKYLKHICAITVESDIVFHRRLDMIRPGLRRQLVAAVIDWRMTSRSLHGPVLRLLVL